MTERFNITRDLNILNVALRELPTFHNYCEDLGNIGSILRIPAATTGSCLTNIQQVMTHTIGIRLYIGGESMVL